MPADVVDLSHPAIVENPINGLAVIFHIQPVPDILTCPVDGQRLVVQGVGNHQRNQLLREVIGAVIVGTPGNRHR